MPLRAQESHDRIRGLRDDLGVGGEVVRTAREQDELTTGDDRCEQATLVGIDREVFLAVDDERRYRELPIDVTSITALVTRLLIACRRVRIGRSPLQFVEMRDERGLGVVAEEAARDDLPEG